MSTGQSLHVLLPGDGTCVVKLCDNAGDVICQPANWHIFATQAAAQTFIDAQIPATLP